MGASVMALYNYHMQAPYDIAWVDGLPLLPEAHAPLRPTVRAGLPRSEVILGFGCGDLMVLGTRQPETPNPKPPRRICQVQQSPRRSVGVSLGSGLSQMSSKVSGKVSMSPFTAAITTEA